MSLLFNLPVIVRVFLLIHVIVFLPWMFMRDVLEVLRLTKLLHSIQMSLEDFSDEHQ